MIKWVRIKFIHLIVNIVLGCDEAYVKRKKFNQTNRQPVVFHRPHHDCVYDCLVGSIRIRILSYSDEYDISGESFGIFRNRKLYNGF